MRWLGWVLNQCDWCPCKRKSGHRYTHRKASVKMMRRQREKTTISKPRRKASEESTCQHLDLGTSGLQNCEKIQAPWSVGLCGSKLTLFLSHACLHSTELRVQWQSGTVAWLTHAIVRLSMTAVQINLCSHHTRQEQKFVHWNVENK